MRKLTITKSDKYTYLIECDDLISQPFHERENFKFDIFCTCPKEYLLKLEQWFLDNMKPEYNICKVAGSCLNRKLSESHKQKIKNAHANGNYKYNLEGLKNFHLQNPNYKPLACETNKKQVIQFDMNNNKLNEYESLKEAAKAVGLKSYTRIGEVCKGKFLSAGGYKWKWKKEN